MFNIQIWFQELGGHVLFYFLKTNLKGCSEPESFEKQCFTLKSVKTKSLGGFIF